MTDKMRMAFGCLSPKGSEGVSEFFEKPVNLRSCAGAGLRDEWKHGD
jgi:hypothetical protein